MSRWSSWKQPPLTAHFQLENLTPPDSLLLSLAPVTPAREIPSADAGHRLWQSGEGWAAGLPLKTGIDYPFQAGEFVNGDGLYLAELHAHWNHSGDVTYGFLMQIGAGSSGLSAQLPTNSAGPGPTPAAFTLQRVSPSARLGKGSASALALSPDGRRLGVVTPLGVYLFDTDSHKEIWYRAFENTATLLAFSPDNSRLAVGSRASILSVLDADTGKTLVQIAGEEYIHAVWSPDGAKLLVSGGCQAIGIWDSKERHAFARFGAGPLQQCHSRDRGRGLVRGWETDLQRCFRLGCPNVPTAGKLQAGHAGIHYGL